METKKDGSKILFVTCVNDESLYAQCERHIKALRVPAGFKMHVGQLREVPGMTQAYNAAIAGSDAKYKVYLHQDTFIINPNFLYDILRIFMSHPDVGLIGVAGCRELPPSGIWWEGKSLLGKLIEHRSTYSVLKFSDPEPPFSPAKAVDGLLMATQYDLPWRDDILSGFHFYDSSQSLEFIRAGYKVAVPAQAEPWCLHYCGKMESAAGYYAYRKVFLDNYKEFIPSGS